MKPSSRTEPVTGAVVSEALRSLEAFERAVVELATFDARDLQVFHERVKTTRATRLEAEALTEALRASVTSFGEQYEASYAKAAARIAEAKSTAGRIGTAGARLVGLDEELKALTTELTRLAELGQALHRAPNQQQLELVITRTAALERSLTQVSADATLVGDTFTAERATALVGLVAQLLAVARSL